MDRLSRRGAHGRSLPHERLGCFGGNRSEIRRAIGQDLWGYNHHALLSPGRAVTCPSGKRKLILRPEGGGEVQEMRCAERGSRERLYQYALLDIMQSRAARMRATGPEGPVTAAFLYGMRKTLGGPPCGSIRGSHRSHERGRSSADVMAVHPHGNRRSTDAIGWRLAQDFSSRFPMVETGRGT